MSGGQTVRGRRVYYGWTLVGTLAVTEMTSWGILYYAFAVFLLPMQRDLGWSRTALTGAFSLALLISGLAGIPVGWWLDRHGPRLLMTAGSALATLLVVAWAAVTSLPAFYLIWAGIGVTLAMVLYEPAFAVVATWFVRYRSPALTWLTFGGGLASVVFIPLAAWLVQTQGWRVALLMLAALLGVITVPAHALVLRRRPADLGLAPDGEPREGIDRAASIGAMERNIPAATALQDSGFWSLTASFALVNLAATAGMVHLIPLLVERGYASVFAATTAGMVGIMALPGRVIFTPLGGRYPRRRVTALIFLLQATAMAALVLVPSHVGVGLFVVLFGAGFGAISPARAALVAEQYGSAAYGSISSVLAACSTLARAAGPVGAGQLYAMLGGYSPVLWVLAVLSAAAAATVLLVPESPRPAAPLRHI